MVYFEMEGVGAKNGNWIWRAQGNFDRALNWIDS